MNVNGTPLKSIRIDANAHRVWVLDQRLLPYTVKEVELNCAEDAISAITDMTVRGAPLIGVVGAAGLALSTLASRKEDRLRSIAKHLIKSRPTAINLAWAVNKTLTAVLDQPEGKRTKTAWSTAREILEMELDMSHKIGLAGVELISKIHQKVQRPVSILTHCNAGWLATVDYGTATAPIYEAWEKKIPIEVLVDETRPRLQGTLTAWELSSHGVPVKLITDSAGGLLMTQGKVDLVITGADRIAANGDTANKIGTYLKALAAADNNIPFYVAAPNSTFDWATAAGNDIPIEERAGDEIRRIRGLNSRGSISEIAITSKDTKVLNPGFDITPSRLITGFITESGVFKPSELAKLRNL